MSDLLTSLAAEPLLLPRFRAKQLAHEMYVRGRTNFMEMEVMPKAKREMLQEMYRIDHGQLAKESLSNDHTRKFLVGVKSKKKQLLASVPDASSSSSSPPLDHIECVYIPMGAQKHRSSAPTSGAVCVSSQIGCSLTCSFCATGAMSKSRLRNLTPAEIVGQVMLVKKQLGDFTPDQLGTEKKHSAVSNIVFMGMGEPLMNYRNVRSAMDILTSHPRAGVGLSMGRPRITLSTSGVAPMLDRLLEDYEGNIALAISLHAVSDALRDELVPVNKQYPLSILMESVRRYQHGRVPSKHEEDERDSTSNDFTLPMTAGRRRVTFEYVMLRSVNDSPAEARQLVRLLDGIESLVNLIPFNPWTGSRYESSSREAILAFSQVLQSAGVKCTVRWPRGRDINGACGQLAVDHEAMRSSVVSV
jgi:23S rRNA (adenine2503-C2)-methyltransferase